MTNESDILYKLAMERKNYKVFEKNTVVEEHDKQEILKAASGLTPALCNEYNFRVNVVKDSLKETLLNNGTFISDIALEVDRADCAYETRYQYLAPFVLVWSLKENLKETHKNKMIGPLTDLFANHIAIGMSVWQTALTAEALGYDTCIYGAKGDSDKREILKKAILGLKAPDETDELKYYPVMFLSIGKGTELSSQHRSDRLEDILNVLELR
jgi:nitroreductase